MLPADLRAAVQTWMRSATGDADPMKLRLGSRSIHLPGKPVRVHSEGGAARFNLARGLPPVKMEDRVDPGTAGGQRQTCKPDRVPLGRWGGAIQSGKKAAAGEVGRPSGPPEVVAGRGNLRSAAASPRALPDPCGVNPS